MSLRLLTETKSFFYYFFYKDNPQTWQNGESWSPTGTGALLPPPSASTMRLGPPPPMTSKLVPPAATSLPPPTSTTAQTFTPPAGVVGVAGANPDNVSAASGFEDNDFGDFVSG